MLTESEAPPALAATLAGADAEAGAADGAAVAGACVVVGVELQAPKRSAAVANRAAPRILITNPPPGRNGGPRSAAPEIPGTGQHGSWVGGLQRRGVAGGRRVMLREPSADPAG